MPVRSSRRRRPSSSPRASLIRVLLLLILIAPLVDISSLPGSNAGAAPAQPDTLVNARAIGPSCGIDESNQTFAVEVCIEIAGGEALTGDVTITMAVSPVSGTAPQLNNLGAQISAVSAAPPNFSSILQDYAAPWTFTMPTYRWRDGSYLIRTRAQYPDRIVNGVRFPVYAVSPAITVTIANGVATAPRSNGTWRPTTGTSGSPLIVAAVGDGAGGLPRADDVANLIDGWDPNMLLYLGDVYNAGKYTEFYNYYEPTLGRFKSITNPVPGNHEGGGDQFRGYRDYWDLDLDYYSIDAGGWHLIALNSDERFNQYGPGSPQYEWLKQDLAANANPCTIAFFHHARFSGGGEGGDVRMDPIWRMLVEQGVDVVLNGHAHNYQRWTQLDGDGQADPDGTTQFIVGTGGHSPFQTVGNNPLMVGKAGGVSGALRLELTPGHASFDFVTTAGDVADTGEISCAPPPAETAVVLAAGDIAHCPSDAKDEETGAIVASQPGTVLALGDLAYDNGSAEDFANCYDPSWGSFRNRTYPVPGNHEYNTPNATGYFDYFNGEGVFTGRAGDRDKGYYSFDLGEWHIVALNSNCDVLVDPTSPETNNACVAGSAQEQWLRADLAANPSTCVLAFWHNARYSSGRHPNYDLVKDLWQALADYGSEIVLSGHNHHYERFAPQDANGNLDPNGIRQFVVGTGGKDFYPLEGGVLKPNSQARQESSFGVLRLELQSNGYTWEFLPIPGSSYSDTGSASCSGAPVEPPPPVTNVTLPARAAFYYPWYPENWTGNPPSQYEPSLGYYDLDTTEVSAHIDQMQYGNIDVGIASWWGPGHHTDQKIPLLLQRAEGTGFKWAFYHEWGSATPPTAEQIEANIAYLVDTYGSHDSVAKIDGRVVIFVTKVSTCEHAQRWIDANTSNAYLVLKVFSGYLSCGVEPDGWHQYAPGSATDKQGDFSFSISPGLHRVQQDPQLPRDPDRWASNVRAMIASNAEWQLITTFNQWSDGSSIESATAWESSTGYGVYLDILHADGVITDPPTITPTPTATTVPTDTPAPTVTPIPTDTPVPTETPAPTGTPIATETVTIEPPSNVTLPARAAFYYPSYPGSWSSGGPFPNSRYEPTLGYYDLDAADVAAHIDQMRYGNIEVGIVAWNGQGSVEDQKIQLLLSQAQGTGFKWAFYYQPEGSRNPTIAELQADIDYLVSTYGAHENVARVDGRVVIFVYNVNDSTCEVVNRWAAANSGSAYVVMKVFSGYRGCNPRPDGWHQFGPAVAADHQRDFSYTISPGLYRTQDQNPQLPRDPVRWASNVRAMVSSGAPWQLITTFNKWSDGTGVESTTAWASASGYGVYLDILHADGQLEIAPTPTATATVTMTATATLTPASTVTTTATPDATATLSTTPSSTSTVTPTPTVTSTPLPTATSTSTATLTATATPVPTATVPIGPLVFTPVADARVERDNPGASFGSAPTLITDNSPMTEAYLLFNVSGLTGSAQTAKLRLWVVDPASNAPPISTCGSATWSESALTWGNRPAMTGSRDDKGAVSSGIWLEYDVTPWVIGNGPLCLALIPQSSNGLDLSSKEGSAPPQLVINGAPAFTVTSNAPAPDEPDTAEPIVDTVYPVAQTSRSKSTVAGTLAIDGNPATVWQTADGNEPGRVAVLTLDLGAPVEIDRLRILTGPAGLAGTITIETSNDGQAWSYFGVPGLVSHEAGVWVDVMRDSGLADPVTARYVRIVCVTTGAETTLGGVAEVEVLPPASPG